VCTRAAEQTDENAFHAHSDSNAKIHSSLTQTGNRLGREHEKDGHFSLSTRQKSRYNSRLPLRLTER